MIDSRAQTMDVVLAVAEATQNPKETISDVVSATSRFRAQQAQQLAHEWNVSGNVIKQQCAKQLLTIVGAPDES
ncbi:MAG: hypothetical protein LBB58_04735 [Cellulomonadaceae bacterium]|jgi:hypothetical protein|nr:hypothetical protein [Cellulomonadaceae bacterium]